MAWERRAKGLYYYRARRIEGRVVKEYVGIGYFAEAAAADDQQRQQRQKHDRQRRREIESKLGALESIFEAYWSFTERLTHLAFTAHHYHRRRGEWRLHK